MSGSRPTDIEISRALNTLSTTPARATRRASSKGKPPNP
jgi:hypothetical protein